MGVSNLVAIYARQSIERPDSVSIDAQMDQCRKFSGEDYKEYSDVGYSGKNTNRPQYEQMIEDIKSGKITSVISYRLDRISRNIIDFANLLELLEKHHVTYLSATEQFDTSTPIGRAMIYIVMVFAQLERETIAGRIADNYKFRCTQGLFMGGNTPFGYDSERISLDGKKISILTPNEQAETLQRMFKLFTSNHSIFSICRTLNQEGILTSKGSSWVNNSIKRVLRNISPCCADENLYHYLIAKGYQVVNPLEDFDGKHGMCLFFKQKNRNQQTEVSQQIAVVGMHRPLISSEQFIHAQSILDKRNPVRSKRSSRTFLAGLVKCKECGYSFGLKYTSKNGSDYCYYHCRGRETRGICQNSMYIPAQELESGILKLCMKHLKNIRSYESKKEKKATYGDHIESLRAQIQNLISNVGKGNSVVDDLLTQKITLLQSQINEYAKNERINNYRQALDSKTIDGLKQQLKNFDQLSMAQKASVIRGMVKRIFVDMNGNLEIQYHF